MPYPLTFPESPVPRIFVRWRTVGGVVESPFTLKQQIYRHPGERWEIDVSLDPMPLALAGPWVAFLHGLDGRVGTFTLDLDDHCPGLDPAPGVVTFRLVDSDPGWDSDQAVLFGISFRAVEDV